MSISVYVLFSIPSKSGWLIAHPDHLLLPVPLGIIQNEFPTLMLTFIFITVMSNPKQSNIMYCQKRNPLTGAVEACRQGRQLHTQFCWDKSIEHYENISLGFYVYCFEHQYDIENTSAAPVDSI